MYYLYRFFFALLLLQFYYSCLVVEDENYPHNITHLEPENSYIFQKGPYDDRKLVTAYYCIP